jgi:hypothetical protein
MLLASSRITAKSAPVSFRYVSIPFAMVEKEATSFWS